MLVLLQYMQIAETQHSKEEQEARQCHRLTICFLCLIWQMVIDSQVLLWDKQACLANTILMKIYLLILQIYIIVGNSIFELEF